MEVVILSTKYFCLYRKTSDQNLMKNYSKIEPIHHKSISHFLTLDEYNLSYKCLK